MKYKAMIFDLDGTAFPTGKENLPSKKVIDAVHKAKKYLKISTASGRSVQDCRKIWKVLGITDPCIISGGSQIMHPGTEEILWEEHIPDRAIPLIYEIARKNNSDLAVNGEIINDYKKISGKPTIIVAIAVKGELVEKITEEYLHIQNLAAHILPTWLKGNNIWDIHITHVEATKKHALKKLLEIIGENKDQIIGVGDGNNDLPLFESAGYKVAMGNAVEKLKKAADYISEDVSEDGLANFINKKILRDFL